MIFIWNHGEHKLCSKKWKFLIKIFDYFLFYSSRLTLVGFGMGFFEILLKNIRKNFLKSSGFGIFIPGVRNFLVSGFLPPGFGFFLNFGIFIPGIFAKSPEFGIFIFGIGIFSRDGISRQKATSENIHPKKIKNFT